MLHGGRGQTVEAGTGCTGKPMGATGDPCAPKSRGARVWGPRGGAQDGVRGGNPRRGANGDQGRGHTGVPGGRGATGGPVTEGTGDRAGRIGATGATGTRGTGSRPGRETREPCGRGANAEHGLHGGGRGGRGRCKCHHTWGPKVPPRAPIGFHRHPYAPTRTAGHPWTTALSGPALNLVGHDPSMPACYGTMHWPVVQSRQYGYSVCGIESTPSVIMAQLQTLNADQFRAG